MPWINGVPIDHGADADRPQSVRAVTLHRTIGTWPGDYSVGKNRRHGSPGTFNILIGADQGQWVQFYLPETKCSHAAGSNSAGPGIEFSGQNGAPLTEWQIQAGGHVIRELSQMFSIPLALHDQPRIQVDGSGYRGFVNHRGVATSPQYQHFDYIEAAEFARMIQTVPAQGEDMPGFLCKSTDGTPEQKSAVWVVNPALGTKAWVSNAAALDFEKVMHSFGLYDDKLHDITLATLQGLRSIEKNPPGF